MAWHIDPAHSEIQFSAKHMMIATVRGKFARFSGTIDGDEQNPTAAQVDVQVEAASIDTGNEQRDAHLRSPDFLNVEQYPYITFKSTKVEQLDAEQGRMYGRAHDPRRDAARGAGGRVRGHGKEPMGHHQCRLQRPDQDQPQGLGAELERGARDGRLVGQRRDQDRD